MNKQEMECQLQVLIDEAKTAVLTTVDSAGFPHARWMTPGCLKDRPGTLFMVSATKFSKIDQVRANPTVELMLQTASLDKIMNVRGKLNVLENPSIRTEVLECIGHRLNAFWKANQQTSDLVVLELVMEEVSLYLPMKGTKESVRFAA